MNTKLMSFGGLALLLALFFALNLWVGTATRRARVDLTDQKLYTLSEGSRKIARSFDEPAKLTLYYSGKLAQGRPGLQTYGTRVREMLDEFASISGGKIQFRTVDPEPSSEAEDAAVAAGLQGVPVAPGESLYFGLVGTNAVDGKELIPFFDPSNERFLEYDISKMLYSLANPKKKTVGVISHTLRLDTPGFDPLTGQPSRQQPYAVLRELKSTFNVKSLPSPVTEIPGDIDVLLVVHPKDLPDTTLYAIDQFVMRGGRLVACVDPHCETDDSGADPRNPLQGMMAPKASSLKKLFDAWGFEVADQKIAADIAYATAVNMGGQGRSEPVTYVGWLNLEKQAFNTKEPVTAQLSRVLMPTPGAIRALAKPAADSEKKEGEPKEVEPKPAPATTPPTVKITPLISTTAQGALMPQSSFQFMPDPKQILNSYVPGKEPLTLAARIEVPEGGALVSAFPAGKPAPAPTPGDPPSPPPADAKAGWVEKTTGPVNMIVIADCDFLSDRFWTQRDQLFQQMIYKVADNGDFLVNCVDNLSGSSDLISVRARGTFARPFDRVVEMQKSAEQKFRAEEKSLQDEIEQAQRRINELQNQKGDQAANTLLLSPEQQKEVDGLKAKMVESRKKLRQVQYNLNTDIDSLYAKLKFVNIALVPVAVTLLAVGLGMYRVARRRAPVQTSAAAMPDRTT